MKLLPGDYVIITATGRRAIVLEAEGMFARIQPLTRNSKGAGRPVEMASEIVDIADLSPDRYGAKP